MKLWPRLRLFFALPPDERALLLAAIRALVAARLAVWFFPHRWLQPRLGLPHQETPEQETGEHLAVAQQIAHAIRRGSIPFCGTATCLTQALAAQRLLTRRGIASTLYLGAAPGGKLRLVAHAWLRVGNFIVTGNDTRQRYTVMTSFCSNPAA